MEIAVVAGGHVHIDRDLGQGTNTDAEWLALIHALRIARAMTRDFVLLGDAAHVIGPASGAAKCRGGALAHHEAFLALAGADGPPPIRYVRRTQNLAGIALARLHPR
jgi:ribonuclease HI